LRIGDNLAWLIKPDFAVPDAYPDSFQVGAAAGALEAFAAGQFEAGAVVGAYQQAFGADEESVRGPIQVTALVWAGIVEGKDVSVLAEQHEVDRASWPVDHDLFPPPADIFAAAQ
jgi:hypothetical protein